jgi:putative (di)nucleoside polyphosphate hydrolase
MQSIKPYRPNVAAIIVPPEYPESRKIFIAERSDISGVWQFPQGGIDKGESPEEALIREIEEEIGTKKVEIVAEYPDWLTYDFPEHIARKMQPYAGQTQRYYLVRLKNKAKIDLDTKHPEFIDYKFIDIDELYDYVAHFKKPIYEKVIGYFKSKGYL